MNAIWAIAMKDLRLLMRDRSAAFFVFGFPLLLALFFGVVFGGLGGNSESAKMSIIAVNEDGGPAGAAFISDLKADDALRVTTGHGPASDAAAEVPFTRAEATELVRKGKTTACVILPKGFEHAAANMFAGGGLTIEALVDPGRKAEGGLLTGKLNEIAFKQMAKNFDDPARMTTTLNESRRSIEASAALDPSQKMVLGSLFNSLQGLADSNIKAGGSAGGEQPAEGGGGGWMPVKVTMTEVAPANRVGPRNAFEISFPQGVVWGLMGCVTAFGVSMAGERSRGTLLRLAVAPITREQVLVGKALSCFIACILVQVLLLAIGMLPGLAIRIGDPLMMTVAVVASAFGFTGVMMILSGFARTEGSASGLGRALIIMLAMIGGGAMPLVFMPAFMETVSGISPFKWSIMAIEGALWRGFSFGDMLLPAAVLTAVGIIGFAIGAVMMRRGSSTELA